LKREVGRLDGEWRFGVLELVPLGITGQHWQFLPESGTGSSTIQTCPPYGTREYRRRRSLDVLLHHHRLRAP